MKRSDSKDVDIDQDEDKAEENHHEKSNIKDDYQNVAILLFLYLLQGIPLGISGAIPILLQNRGVSYAEQAVFTFAFYPFTLKILWAPIVDSAYIKAIGRRKSWLVPAQILIGSFMIFLSYNVDEWLGDGDTKKPQMILLTSVFFILWFLTATQDISVDGWALTMLQRKNVGHAATCNVVGQTAGFFTGYVVFLVLQSKEFSNNYIFAEPHDEGLVTLAGFLKFWGVVFLGTTVLIAVFKREKPDDELENNPDYSVKKAYPMLWKVLKLKSIFRFSLVLLTAKASFVACDAITTLKLVEYGVPKEKLALLSIPLFPVQILLPFIISRYTTGKYPMTLYIKSFPYRLILTVLIAAFVYVTPTIIKNDPNNIPAYFYVALVSIYLIYQVPLRSMYTADMAFMAKISDPLVGGTYMTLLNTISNLGSSWVKTFFLWLVDVITWKSCIYEEYTNSTIVLTDNKCIDKAAKAECASSGGQCRTDIDGYYIEIALNVLYGIIWFQWGKRMLVYLQNLERNEWYILTKVSDVENAEATPLDENKKYKLDQSLICIKMGVKKVKRDCENREKTIDDDEPNLKGDYRNIIILFYLYVLQGVPMGITHSMIVMLQSRGVSYTDQALFTLAVYPFSFKILWAPIVDCVYVKAFGRRKTWLIPSQILIGAAMLFLAQKVDDWFGNQPAQKPQMALLTTVFFLLWLLTATQDISVDGWSLTMLQRKNVGYSATVNCVGQSLGGFFGYFVFLTLESKDFCNQYIFSEPREEGLLKLSGFLKFWGIAFMAVTVAIAVFKRETSENHEALKSHAGPREAYPLLWKIVKLKPILLASSIFSTVGIGFAANDMMSNLKLIDYGIPRDKIAMFDIPSILIQLILPIIISKHTAGSYPMKLYFKAYPLRLALSVVTASIVYATPKLLHGRFHDIPVYYYAAIMTTAFFYDITVRMMNTADMSFFAHVADPIVGGTYMTLMNITYIGGKFFKSFSVWFVDIITWKSCVFEVFSNTTTFLMDNKCENDLARAECFKNGGHCKIDIDGYYIEVAFNVIFGIFWFKWAKGIINYLETLPVSDWHVLSNKIQKDREMLPLKKELA